VLTLAFARAIRPPFSREMASASLEAPPAESGMIAIIQ
jgi:hypothetical protein